MKKIFLSLLCIILLCMTTVGSYGKASANSFVDAPGYTDELFESLMTGAMTVAGGAAHAQDTINDNLDMIRSTARDLWSTYSPQAKEAFKQGLTFTADGIVLAGDAITSFLDSLAPKFTDISNPSNVLHSGGLTITSVRNSKTFVLDSIDGKTVKIDNATSFTVGFYEYSNSGEFYVLGAYNQTAEVNKEIFNSLKAQFEGVSSVAALARLLQRINDYGGYSRKITVNYGGTLISDFDVPVDPIYNQADRWLRDRANAGGLTLGLPRAVPYSNTDRPLEIGGTGVLLDGVPYTGKINWKDTVLGVPGSYDGVANLPLLYLDGKPLHWVTTADGSTNLVTGDGAIVTDLNSVQTMPNDVIYVDGVPHAMTSTGALVNLKTGEIVANVPDTTIPGDVTGLWSQLWQWLSSILDAIKAILSAILALPLKLLELLKAMLLALFVPSEGFWTDNMNNLKSLLWGDTIDDLTGEFSDLDGARSGSFKDVIVSLMGVKDLVVIDADSVNAVLDYIHKWVRGVIYPFILIYNINMLYKLIRGTSLVEVTRSMRYKAGD